MTANWEVRENIEKLHVALNKRRKASIGQAAPLTVMEGIAIVELLAQVANMNPTPDYKPMGAME